MIFTITLLLAAALAFCNLTGVASVSWWLILAIFPGISLALWTILAGVFFLLAGTVNRKMRSPAYRRSAIFTTTPR